MRRKNRAKRTFSLIVQRFPLHPLHRVTFQQTLRPIGTIHRVRNRNSTLYTFLKGDPPNISAYGSILKPLVLTLRHVRPVFIPSPRAENKPQQAISANCSHSLCMLAFWNLFHPAIVNGTPILLVCQEIFGFFSKKI